MLAVWMYLVVFD